ncbi:MAG: zinc metallopeptidase [Pirellula sp.]
MMYLLFAAPALLLAMYAQWRVSAAYSQMSQVPARMTGAQAARRILDSAGLRDIPIEEVPGHLSDHYDPTSKVVRLSSEVYHNSSMASVGIAAHEVGHAIQDAKQYAPLVIRNLAVPAANFGGGMASVVMMVAMGMFFAGMAKLGMIFLLLGIVGFTLVVFFQVVNLPVEFDASSRAKTELVSHGIVSGQELPYVSRVLNAAALTYVAGTLQAVSTLLYYVVQFTMMSDRESY